jgi:hypothetical protein
MQNKKKKKMLINFRVRERLKRDEGEGVGGWGEAREAVESERKINKSIITRRRKIAPVPRHC